MPRKKSKQSRAGKKAKKKPVRRKRKLKIAIVSLTGRSSQAIAKAAEKHFGVVKFYSIKDVGLEVGKENGVFCKNEDLKKFDCVYLRGSFNYIDSLASVAIALNSKIYTPIRPESFFIAHNKFLTEVRLKEAKIPVPETYLVNKSDTAKQIIESNKLKYPVVFKVLSGTHGKGVMFADSEESAKSMIDMMVKFNEPYLIQEYIETGARDIRAVVIGKKVIAMERRAGKGELRAGIHSGGKGKKIDLDYDTEQIAIKTAKAIGADVCAVDLLKGGSKVVVTEVNLSPGLIGISEAVGKNVAEDVAEFLYKKTLAKRRKRTKDEKVEKPAMGKEVIFNLDIKAGRIRLPEGVAKMCGFEPDEECFLDVEKGKVAVKKVKEED